MGKLGWAWSLNIQGSRVPAGDPSLAGHGCCPSPGAIHLWSLPAPLECIPPGLLGYTVGAS